MTKTVVPISNFKAAIFDMDGTMVANTPYHQQAWRLFLQAHDIYLSKEEFDRKMVGKKNDELIRSIFGNQLTDAEVRRYADEKEATYRNLYASDITEVAGLSQCVKRLRETGIKTGVATTASKENRDFTLEALGLADKFEIIMGDEHSKHGKPHPEIYLHTSQSLGTPPHECIAFEDSPSGVASAKDAGMTVVGVLTYHTKEELSRADYWIRDFTELEF